MDYYKSLGVFDSVSRAYNQTFSPKVFDYLGMQFAADIATHMTSLRDQ